MPAHKAATSPDGLGNHGPNGARFPLPVDPETDTRPHYSRHGLVRWYGAAVMVERLAELRLSMFGTGVYMETHGRQTRERLQEAERMFQACVLLDLAARTIATVSHDE
jgi:hypothetical protein